MRISFRDITCAHLAAYKVSVLNVSEDGLFHYRGRDIPMPHILPLAHRDLNIIASYRDKFWSSDHSKVKLHRYFHHLNSSQALCINLFYPLIAENALGIIMQYLGIASGNTMQAQFEAESDIEIAARRTSFDFFAKPNESTDVFVEVKYTEDGFGRAENDYEHQAKFQKTYLPLVKGSRFLTEECQDQKFFLEHYQILRNLIHINESSYVVLLFPSANGVVAQEAAFAREKLLNDAGRPKLKIVFLEELVSFLEARVIGGSLEDYYRAFRTKYLP